MLSADLVRTVATSSWFGRRWSPYALLDRDWRIHATNQAFQDATGHDAEVLRGRVAFEAFPDNPDDPSADGAAAVMGSLEKVLRTRTPDWMPFQRYDVPDPERPGRFVLKVWMPVNVPVCAHGRVVAVLHHVQDVSSLLGPHVGGPGALDATAYDPQALGATAELLAAEFPHAPVATVVGLLTDSQRVVLDVLGHAATAKAVELARIRLEVQAGTPGG